MCLICVELIKDRLTSREAMRNLSELVEGRELDAEQQMHVMDVLGAIEKKAQKEAEDEHT